MAEDTIYRQQAIDTCMREDVRTGYDGACLIAQLPSAQPERKKGRWKLLNNGDAICSECGRKQRGVWDFDNWDNFCRHCGADMRGEEHD